MYDMDEATATGRSSEKCATISVTRNIAIRGARTAPARTAAIPMKAQSATGSDRPKRVFAVKAKKKPAIHPAKIAGHTPSGGRACHGGAFYRHHGKRQEYEGGGVGSAPGEE